MVRAGGHHVPPAVQRAELGAFGKLRGSASGVAISSRCQWGCVMRQARFAAPCESCNTRVLVVLEVPVGTVAAVKCHVT
ncbi:hypothetical protein NDU88_006217 [Pleurodeles waltl]|uniref:Uncharacterized protein n=1 Tax=Pleurodeles waltl TaxID=8319 RepID=A0AAV7WEX3_PLEWA|nr:hypothetical protein NDU88_006217 [Pleurodeles waltl]